MGEMYGLDPKRMVMNERPNDNIATGVYIDLADVMRAYADGMYCAFQMGQAARGIESSETITPSSDTNGLPFQKYIGIYDNSGYGVYCNPQKLEASKTYWNKAFTHYYEFPSYKEALNFAKQGVASYMGVPVHTIPDPQYPLDWRQGVQGAIHGTSNAGQK